MIGGRRWPPRVARRRPSGPAPGLSRGGVRAPWVLCRGLRGAFNLGGRNGAPGAAVMRASRQGGAWMLQLARGACPHPADCVCSEHQVRVVQLFRPRLLDIGGRYPPERVVLKSLHKTQSARAGLLLAGLQQRAAALHPHPQQRGLPRSHCRRSIPCGAVLPARCTPDVGRALSWRPGAARTRQPGKKPLAAAAAAAP